MFIEGFWADLFILQTEIASSNFSSAILQLDVYRPQR